MIDKINGEMFLDFSGSSLALDDIDLYGGDDDDDDESLTDSVDSDNDSNRKVSFSDELVSDVWERPYTTVEERKILFYTGREIGEFRMEYKANIKRRKAALIAARTLALTNPSNQATPSTPSKAQTLSTTLSGFGTILKKATQVGTALTQFGQFLPAFAQQEEVSDSMLVIDTLYLF